MAIVKSAPSEKIMLTPFRSLASDYFPYLRGSVAVFFQGYISASWTKLPAVSGQDEAHAAAHELFELPAGMGVAGSLQPETHPEIYEFQTKLTG